MSEPTDFFEICGVILARHRILHAKRMLVPCYTSKDNQEVMGVRFDNGDTVMLPCDLWELLKELNGWPNVIGTRHIEGESE